MERSAFREELFRYSKELGCTAAETFFCSETAFDVSVREGEAERYTAATKQSLNLRVRMDNRDGYAYTETMEDAETLVRRAIDNARAIEEEDDTPFVGAQTYLTLSKERAPMLDWSEQEKIAYAKRMEQAALSADARIKRVSGSEVETVRVCVELHNTEGLCAVREGEDCAAVVDVVAEEGETVKDAYALYTGVDADKMEELVQEAVQKAVFRLDAAPVETGKYRVVLKHEALNTLLTGMLPMFSAEEAQRGRSLLSDKEGKTIAAPCVHLMDDPHHPSLARAFDGEGMPTKRTDILSNGTLLTLLHNRKTAKRAGRETTGNAVRSASGPVSVGPNKFRFCGGETSYEALLEELRDGLVIDSLAGAHAGIDFVSGDFSLMASGALVADGKIVRAVDRITVAGNFLTLLRDVEAVANDEKTHYGGTVCPSILLRELQIAGK